MAFDYLTLNALVLELRDHLLQKKVNRVQSGPDGLEFACVGSGHVRARVGPQGYLCWVAEKLPQASSAPLGPERYLLGAQVEDLWWDKKDRIVRIRLSRKDKTGAQTYGQLICELIRPHCQVCLIREQNGEVLGQWAAPRKNRTQRIVVGKAYAPPAAQEKLHPGKDSFSLFRAAAEHQDGPALDLLTRVVVALDKNLALELLHRVGLAAEVKIADLGEGGLEKLWGEAAGLYTHYAATKAYIWQAGGRGEFSALELTSKVGNHAELPSISEAILQVHLQSGRPEKESHRGQDLQQALSRARKSTIKKIQNLQLDLEEASRAGELEKKGNVLMALLGQVRSGTAEVELADIYDISGKTFLKIELDPGRSPAENAKWFLKTARKYQRRCQIVPGYIEKMNEQLVEAERFLEQVQGGEESCFADIEKWLEERGSRTKMTKKQQHREAIAHPRRYRTSQGWSVWAGRNNKENDLLTHRLADQNDLWFHAHGYAGAHVVLRREDRREEPSGKNLEEAAAVAAYWSKGKTAKKVPVVYTLVKYVSKPRGGAPGQALMRREKTLMVAPVLPMEEDSGKIDA